MLSNKNSKIDISKFYNNNDSLIVNKYEKYKIKKTKVINNKTSIEKLTIETKILEYSSKIDIVKVPIKVKNNSELYDIDFLVEKFNKEEENIKDDIFDNINIKFPNNILVCGNKTYINGIKSFLESINRDKELLFFFFNKFYSNNIVIEEDLLIINIKINSKDFIKEYFSKFVKKYVKCQEKSCNSYNTEIIKENKSFFLICNFCKYKKNIIL